MKSKFDFDREKYKEMVDVLKEVNTVCWNADCPNRYECFCDGTGTFMILGNVCTRDCKYCDVSSGVPSEVDLSEVDRIKEVVDKLDLDYVVITSVTRDDLGDGGSEQFVRIIEKLRGCGVEVLIPDLKGENLRKVVRSKPDVVNHNIEIVKEKFNELRPQGDYYRSLQVLKKVKEIDPSMKTKSGLMVGFGESKKMVVDALKDLKDVGCDMITIGQYLKPMNSDVKVKKYYSEEEFEEFKRIGEEMGFRIESGKNVRSSYHAKEMASY